LRILGLGVCPVTNLKSTEPMKNRVAEDERVETRVTS
jgi:hypothetical protein